MVAHFGLEVVHAYMRHVQDNAEEQVRRVIDVLKDGAFAYEMDDGAVIRVAIRSRPREPLGDDRLHRHLAAAAEQLQRPAGGRQGRGALRLPHAGRRRHPAQRRLPEAAEDRHPGRLDARPRWPAAVVAGNVETSQVITDALYGALGVMAAAQGTMNNFTFGNERHQYYETICGGSGAGPDFDGTDAVHTHMTNTRLTDPEVLEWRFPVLLRRFAIRRGSGGAGRHHGGCGVIRRIEFREAMTAAILSGHRRVPPFGLCGGSPGDLGRNRVERADGAIETLSGTDRTEMRRGDVFVVETPGGGGFGAAT